MRFNLILEILIIDSAASATLADGAVTFQSHT